MNITTTISVPRLTSLEVYIKIGDKKFIDLSLDEGGRGRESTFWTKNFLRQNSSHLYAKEIFQRQSTKQAHRSFTQ